MSAIGIHISGLSVPSRVVHVKSFLELQEKKNGLAIFK